MSKTVLRQHDTYKCQSELVGDIKLHKITSESRSQKLARKLAQAVAVCWGCNMGIPIGGSTGQLLCMGVDGAVALYGNSSVILMRSGRSVPINFKSSF
jgi:hypothetical protein